MRWSFFISINIDSIRRNIILQYIRRIDMRLQHGLTNYPIVSAFLYDDNCILDINEQCRNQTVSSFYIVPHLVQLLHTMGLSVLS